MIPRVVSSDVLLGLPARRDGKPLERIEMPAGVGY
jgi:hypothetical protein